MEHFDAAFKRYLYSKKELAEAKLRPFSREFSVTPTTLLLDEVAKIGAPRDPDIIRHAVRKRSSSDHSFVGKGIEVGSSKD